jgi:proline racemase
VILGPGSYPPMCGHCMIGFAAVAAELGLVDALADGGTLKVETPAGLIELQIRQSASGARAVTLTNVLSYVVDELYCTLDSGDRLAVQLLFGGDYYLAIDTDGLPFNLEAENAGKIVSLANEVRSKLTREVLRDPLTGETLDVYQMMLFDRSPGVTPTARVVVVAPPGVIDRSPCGTGTSALLASLIASGELTTTDLLTTHSIVGGSFGARAADAKRDARGGIRPMITGTAFITGVSTVFADERDPLGDGFPPLI